MSDFYLIRKITMDNIGDAIREKTEITTKINPVDMPERIRSIQSSSSDSGSGDSGNTGSGDSTTTVINITGYPDYVIEESTKVSQTVNARRDSINNPFTFLVMTDMHEMGSRDSDESNRIKNHRANLNAGQGAKLISDQVSLDFFANLGDLSWSSDNKDSGTITLDTVYSIGRARGYTAAVEEDNVSFILRGNHDVETAEGFIDSDYVTDITGNYGYYDFTSKKVRVIYLNTADNSTSDTDHNVGATQLQWFCETLGSTISGWNIIILSHHPAGSGSNGVASIADCLYAYLSGTTFTSGSVSYNFSGKNLATIVAQFHGHVHCYKVAKITTSSGLTTSIPRIAIPNACHTRDNEYGMYQNDLVYGQPSNETVYKVDKTAQNTAFNVVTIDFKNKRIYADIYGAGENRVIDYESGESIATCSVTSNLTNVTFTGASSVALGSSYTATVSANDGCELTSVKVVMGGTDITSSCYSNGQINISSVTGNIVITASATRTEFATFKITRAANNVVIGSTGEVLEDSRYTETIVSSAGADKALEVYLTMGGKDITSALNGDGTPMYCNGTIDIKKVTGDIDINATGYDVENLVRSSVSHTSTSVYNTVGYKNGIRLSETSPYDSALATHVTTGLIPYTWNPSNSLYIKGIDILSSDNQQEYSRFYGYKSDKVTIPNYARITFNPNAAETHSFVDNFTVETLGDKYFKVTPVKDISTASYMRISLLGTGENLIITINEPIIPTTGGDEPDEPETNVITIIQHPQDVIVDEGEFAYFSIEATTTKANAELTYTWEYKDASASSWITAGVKNNTFGLNGFESGCQVRCTVSDGTNTVTSNVATITINSSTSGGTTVLSITSQPQHTSVEPGTGTDAFFTVEATGNGLSFVWEITEDNGNSWDTLSVGSGTSKYRIIEETATSSTLRVNSVTINEIGEMYRCKITDINGDTVTSNPASLTATNNNTGDTSLSILSSALDYDGEGVFNGNGYKDGYYVTTTAPYTNASSQGAVATGLFEYPLRGEGNTRSYMPATIHIIGVPFDTSYSHNRIGFFDSNFVCGTTQNVSNLSTYYDISKEDDVLHYILTPKMNDSGQNIMAAAGWNYQYIAISVVGSGSDLGIYFESNE